ncbi:hypothetical protein [Microbacterium sp. NPDC079208]|uniref:hypothetical protein n=1 Tax=Microbacterium sp. NPDC079208 TaxID=3154652 RepID=UPI00344B6903
MFGNVFAVTVILLWFVVVGGVGYAMYFMGIAAYRQLRHNSRHDVEQERRGRPDLR